MIDFRVEFASNVTELKFTVSVPFNSYLGIVYTGTMSGSDAVAFQGYP